MYNRKEGKTECICDEQDGYVFWNETGRCYRVYSQVRKQPACTFDLIAGYKYVYTVIVVCYDTTVYYML